MCYPSTSRHPDWISDRMWKNNAINRGKKRTDYTYTVIKTTITNKNQEKKKDILSIYKLVMWREVTMLFYIDKLHKAVQQIYLNTLLGHK